MGRDFARTAVKQGFPNSPAVICDHRRVPPRSAIRGVISAYFGAVRDVSNGLAAPIPPAQQR